MKTNKLILIISLLILSGCNSEVYEMKSNVIPEGLKDCKFYYIYDPTENSVGEMKIVRCPNSSTSVKYRTGKVFHQNSTIEDSMIEEKDEPISVIAKYE